MSTQSDELVRFANEAFYSAFANGDVQAMDQLWAREHACVCLHPGAPPLFDRDEIMTSWQHILSDAGVQDMRMHSPVVMPVEQVALVICYETLGGGTLVATNGFVLEQNQWRMVMHQAGPCAEPDIPAPPSDVDDPQIH